MKINKLIILLIVGCIVLTGCNVSEITNESSSQISDDGNPIEDVLPQDEVIDNNTEIVVIGKPLNRMMIARGIRDNEMPSTQLDTYDDPYINLQYAITETNTHLALSEVEQKQTITIAVIDTGVDYTHEDLKNRVNVKDGYDFVNDDKNPMDDNGHGTHVAGIIAAEANNGTGIAGMVGDLDVEIVPLKALEENGSGIAQDIADAIIYATQLDVDIINLSLGTQGYSKAIDEAVTKALESGIFVVAASGNDGSLTGFASPVGIDGVIAVGATNIKGEIADFSNFGLNIDIGAPGENIVSTLPNNQYAAQDGTSMATPIITSAVAILLAENPNIEIDTMYSLLCDNTTEISDSVEREKLWFGIVDIYSALIALKSV